MLNHNPLDQKFQQASALQQAGKHDEARALCKQIIKQDPQHSGALHILSVIAHHNGYYPQALALIEQAIAQEPNNAEMHYNRGFMLAHNLAQPIDAIASFDRAISLNPDYVMAYLQRGMVLHSLAEYDLALLNYEHVIKLEPSANAYFQRACTLKALGLPQAALYNYQQAIAYAPEFIDALSNMGVLLQEMGQIDAAMRYYNQALAINPDFAVGYYNRALAWQKQRKLAEAVADYDRAIALNPRYAEAYSNSGVALHELQAIDEAIKRYQQAIALKPDYAEAHSNYGMALQAKQKLPEAINAFERATELKPDYAEAQLNKGLALLLQGDLQAGWHLYEWRWRHPALQASQRQLNQPLWLGDAPVDGKVVLLYHEQGLGDTLQFCRYIPQIYAMGARDIVLEVPDSLHDLLQHSFSNVRVRAEHSTSDFDVHCPIASLPLACQTFTESAIPQQVPYLRVDDARIETWAARLPKSTKPRVGLVWSGGFRTNQPELWYINERRNVPFPLIATLQDLPCEFYSLQKGEPAESQLAQDKAQHWQANNLQIVAQHLHSFADTAALMMHLDLIIAVDTSVVHLACALGKPTWMLNRADSCWRWLLERADSAWYPTLKIYRQTTLHQWDEVLERVREDLACWCEQFT